MELPVRQVPGHQHTDWHAREHEETRQAIRDIRKMIWGLYGIGGTGLAAVAASVAGVL